LEKIGEFTNWNKGGTSADERIGILEKAKGEAGGEEYKQKVAEKLRKKSDFFMSYTEPLATKSKLTPKKMSKLVEFVDDVRLGRTKGKEYKEALEIAKEYGIKTDKFNSNLADQITEQIIDPNYKGILNQAKKQFEFEKIQRKALKEARKLAEIAPSEKDFLTAAKKLDLQTDDLKKVFREVTSQNDKAVLAGADKQLYDESAKFWRKTEGKFKKSEILESAKTPDGKLKQIYRQSIANEDFVYGDYPIIKGGKLDPEVVKGRVNDVVLKLKKEGIDPSGYLNKMKNKSFKDYFEFDKYNRGNFC
jgi:hypothetical protein